MSDEELLNTFRALLAPAPELTAMVGASTAPSPSAAAPVQSPAAGYTQQRAQALPSAGADTAGSNRDGNGASQAQNSSSASATGLGQSLSDTGAAIRRRLPFLPSPELPNSNSGGVQQTESPPAILSVAPAAESPALPSQSPADASQAVIGGKPHQPSNSRQPTLPRAPDSTSSPAAPSDQRPRSAADSASMSAPNQPPASASEGAAEEADRTADLLATLGAPVPPDDPTDAAMQRDSVEGDLHRCSSTCTLQLVTRCSKNRDR